MQLCPLLLPFIFAATAVAADPIAGSWINDNPATGGVTRLVVRSDDHQLFVRAWGACHPADCDWGEVQGALHGAGCKATWDHGFATTSMQLLPLEDGRLQARYKADFHDSSGRHDRGSEVVLAPAILPDTFGDRGTPRNEEAEALLRPLPCED
jgi:hypothetical protein